MHDGNSVEHIYLVSYRYCRYWYQGTRYQVPGDFRKYHTAGTR